MERALLAVMRSEDGAERATSPFIMAVAAPASDMRAAFALQMAGAWLVNKGQEQISQTRRPSPSGSAKLGM